MNYKKIYQSLIERAQSRVLETYVEKHHVVPRCLGGDDSGDNLVSLTPEEHYVAHQLLVKIYPGNHSLVKAATKMVQGRPSNKMYGWLKRRLSKVRSVEMNGSGNTMYDKRWVSNENETILLDKDTAEKYISTGTYIVGKKAKRASCGHLVRTRCIECEGLKRKAYDRKKQEAKLLAEDLFQEFKNSGLISICEFARYKNTSQPRLSQLWKKYIPEYTEKVRHGKSIFQNIAH